MATNGVYFGAEIVRDLTPAPGSRMAKRRGEEAGWELWGAGSLHLRLPLFAFSPGTPLGPSVHLFLPLPYSCQCPPCLYFWAALQDPIWAPR